MSLTIAVVLYNEKNEIQKTLNALWSELQSHKVDKIQLLFLDNASTDSSLEIVKEWANREKSLNVQCIKRDLNNMGLARAQAIELCKTSHLVFLDVGSYVEPGWLKGVLNTMNNWPEDTGAVGGPSPYIAEQNWQIFAKDLAHIFPWGGTVSSPQEVSHLPTNNLLIDVGMAKQVGSFKSYFSYVGEDLDFSARLSRRYKMLFSPNFIVRHKLPDSFYDWLRKMAFYGRAQTMTLLENRGGVDRKKFIPLFLTAFLTYGMLLHPLFFQLIFLVSMVIPRLRFLVLSFLFYGFGEFVGVILFYWSRRHFIGLNSPGSTRHKSKT